MLLNDYIPLQRGNRDSVVQMMEQIEQALAQGSSLMMFAEGTRSAPGELKVRKTGAFELAVAAQVPIVRSRSRAPTTRCPSMGSYCVAATTSR